MCFLTKRKYNQFLYILFFFNLGFCFHPKWSDMNQIYPAAAQTTKNLTNQQFWRHWKPSNRVRWPLRDGKQVNPKTENWQPGEEEPRERQAVSPSGDKLRPGKPRRLVWRAKYQKEPHRRTPEARKGFPLSSQQNTDQNQSWKYLRLLDKETPKRIKEKRSRGSHRSRTPWEFRGSQVEDSGEFRPSGRKQAPHQLPRWPHLTQLKGKVWNRQTTSKELKNRAQEYL